MRIENPNERVTITNTRDWALSFSSMDNPTLGFLIPPHQSMRVPYFEIENQAQMPDSFFYGTDGLGSHAAIRIADNDVRAQLFGLKDGEEANQEQIDLAFVKDLLKIPTMAKFEEKMKSSVQTDGDKHMLARLAVAAGIDEVQSGGNKRKRIEQYTGYSVVEPEEQQQPDVITTVRPFGE